MTEWKKFSEAIPPKNASCDEYFYVSEQFLARKTASFGSKGYDYAIAIMFISYQASDICEGGGVTITMHGWSGEDMGEENQNILKSSIEWKEIPK